MEGQAVPVGQTEVTSPHCTCPGQTPVLKQCQELPREKKKRIQMHHIKDSTID